LFPDRLKSDEFGIVRKSRKMNFIFVFEDKRMIYFGHKNKRLRDKLMDNFGTECYYTQNGKIVAMKD
jgi:hypothetical protein